MLGCGEERFFQSFQRIEKNDDTAYITQSREYDEGQAIVGSNVDFYDERRQDSPRAGSRGTP